MAAPNQSRNARVTLNFAPLTSAPNIEVNAGTGTLTGSARWTTRQTGELIRIYGEVVSRSSAEGGLKSQEWNQVTNDFNEACSNFPPPDTLVGMLAKQQIQNKISELKSQFNIFHALKSNSGFGWDETTKLPTAPDNVWNHYISIHKKAAPFRTKTLPFYEQLFEIFVNRAATGEFATASGLTVDESSSDESESSPPRVATISSSTSSSIERSGGSNSVSRSGGSNQSQNSRKRAKVNGQLAIAASIQSLADTKNRSLPQQVLEANQLFKEKFAEDFSKGMRVDFYVFTAKNPDLASIFLALDDPDEQMIFIRNTVFNGEEY